MSTMPTAREISGELTSHGHEKLSLEKHKLLEMLLQEHPPMMDEFLEDDDISFEEKSNTLLKLGVTALRP